MIDFIGMALFKSAAIPENPGPKIVYQRYRSKADLSVLGAPRPLLGAEPTYWRHGRRVRCQPKPDLGQKGFEPISSLTRRYMTLGTIDEVCKDQTVDVDKIATSSNQIGSAQP